MANNHQLPLFPPGVVSAFRSLCQILPDSELPKLREMLTSSLDSFMKVAEDKPLLDVQGAKQIYEVCNYLLDIYPDSSSHQKSLIIGAIRYCVIDQDIFDDTVYVTGLFDDKKVINFVLESLNIHNKYLQIF